eukprot:1155838-Pelagomonas_calceolata.AAC.2
MAGGQSRTCTMQGMAHLQVWKSSNCFCQQFKSSNYSNSVIMGIAGAVGKAAVAHVLRPRSCRSFTQAHNHLHAFNTLAPHIYTHTHTHFIHTHIHLAEALAERVLQRNRELMRRGGRLVDELHPDTVADGELCSLTLTCRCAVQGNRSGLLCMSYTQMRVQRVTGNSLCWNPPSEQLFGARCTA